MMSIDGRIRNELTRDASEVGVDVERLLGAVVTGGRRKRRLRRVGTVVAAAAVVAMVAMAGPAVVDLIRHERGQPAEPGPAPATDILGTYAVTIRSTDVRGLGQLQLQGLWQLTVRGDWLMTVVPPPDAGVSTLRSQYQVDGDRVLTTAFASDTCSGIGVYRWSRAGSTLRFTLVSDACELRVTVFTARSWLAR